MSSNIARATTPDMPSAPSHDPRTPCVSPALGVGASPRHAAYEMKFLLTEELARRVEVLLMDDLRPDIHTDPALGGMYSVTSLALDGPGLPVFYRDRCVRNRKYRVRVYSPGGPYFLERKRSCRGRVRKRRVEASALAFAAIADDRALDASHAWFLREVRTLDLAPVCRLRYLRRALFGGTADVPMRVTFDRSVIGSVARAWTLEPQGEERTLLVGAVVCEFKFHDALPPTFKRVISSLGLTPRGISKYRTCIRAFGPEFGLPPEIEEPAAEVSRA